VRKKWPRRVLLAFGWYDYRLHRGIEKYAYEHGWVLYVNLARERVIPWGWQGDGILAWLGAGDDLAEFVRLTNKPTVDFSYRRPYLKFARVLEDHAAAARLVAEHFVERGLRSFAFYSEIDNWSYEERGEGFISALAKYGYTCKWLRWNRAPEYTTSRDQWPRKCMWLARELKQLPKPLGVFAANDDHALDVLDACKLAGLSVPEDVAVVGAENYLLAPEAMETPISSVDTNLELMGYKGAELLDRLMNGEKPPPEPIRIPPAKLIVRKSSDLLAVNHQGVAAALKYLYQHINEPVRIKELAAIAGLSGRGLHKAFVQCLGRTPGRELRRIRILRARMLLVDSDKKVEEIASLCGYPHLNSFCVAFKHETGLTPSEYRRRFSRT